jgi:hypothetical protein
MEPRRVFYTPTFTNQAMVARLRELDRFKDVEFVALPTDRRERWNVLKAIDGRAAFIWGDGTSHHESYAFTYGTGIELKLNIDEHSDDFHCQIIDRVLHDGEIDGIGYSNHMKVIESDRVEGIHLKWPRRLEEAKGRVRIEKEGKVAVTVDSDVFPLVPVRSRWISTRGLDPEAVAEFILHAGEKLIRLDIGGIVEGVERFDLIPRENLVTPEMDEVRVVSDNCQKDGGAPKVTQEIINNVVSRAFWIYADILGAFFGVND